MLMVEDSADDAALITRELRRGGYAPECRRVETRSEFNAALETDPWDVIVSDFALPGYGGLLALSDLRASGRDIPFILVSGTIGETVAVEAMRAGAQDYVLKHDLTRLPAAIARELRERTIRAEKERMREQLSISERMASAGMLAAGLVHEINNPLAVAIANVEYIASGLAGLSAADRGEPIHAAVRDASEALARIRELVVDVRLFSRPLDVATGAVDVRRVLDTSARMALSEIRHRARLTKEYGEVVLVSANESRLGQVLLNLLVNAAQAIPEGDPDSNQIRLVAKTDDAGRVLVEVHDTGCGISPLNLERIFQPFFTTKPVGMGTGLGLSICHRIVTELGGEISVESQVARGSCFRLTLPPAPGLPEAIRAHSDAPAARRLRILVVDDEESIGTAVKRIASRLHDVVSVTRAEEALARINAGDRFDVILSDLMMPHMTGMELHAQLLALAPDQAQRVVFLTGGAFAAPAQEYLLGVQNRLLEKPFAIADLLAALVVAGGPDPKSA